MPERTDSLAQAKARSTGRQAARVLLSLFSLWALGTQLSTASASAATAAGQAILPYGAIWAVGLFGLWKLYGAWLHLERPLKAAGLWLLSVLFSAVVTLAQSYAAEGTAGLVSARPWSALLFFGGRVILYYAAMFLLDNALSRPVVAQPTVARPAAWPGWLYAVVLLLCWLPYLFFIFPGTVSNDSVTQVMEIIGVEPLSNANPIFQTAIVYLCRGLGVVLGSMDGAVFLYCGFQAAAMAWLAGAVLGDMAKGGAPRWLVGVSLGFFALCPIFPLFAFCMGKDTNFSMAVLWLSLLTLRLVRTPGEPKLRPSLALCLASALCVLLRNPGVYLASLTLVILFIWTVLRCRDGRWKAPAAALASVAVVYGALHLFLLPGLSIAPMPETEHWSVPLQQTARVVIAHDLTPEEIAAVDGVLDMSKLAEAYNGELSDPVKFLWNQDATEEQKAAFFQTWRGFLAKYPGTCLSAVFHNTYGYLYPGYMSAIKPTLLIGRQKRSTPQVEAAFGYSVNPRADSLLHFFNRLAANPLYRILIAPGLYGWICLFAVTALLRRGKGSLLIAAVPALFSLAGCLLSAVNGYFRYAMPLYICAPLLLWLCAAPLPAETKSTLQ